MASFAPFIVLVTLFMSLFSYLVGLCLRSFMMLHSEAAVELKDVRRLFQEASQPRGMFSFNVM